MQPRSFNNFSLGCSKQSRLRVYFSWVLGNWSFNKKPCWICNVYLYAIVILLLKKISSIKFPLSPNTERDRTLSMYQEGGGGFLQGSRNVLGIYLWAMKYFWKFLMCHKMFFMFFTVLICNKFIWKFNTDWAENV